MEKITIQIHDYDAHGFYHIVDEKEVTPEQLYALKKAARESVRVEWDKLPEASRHIVYYAELLDQEGEPWLAAVYMHGEAYDDSSFYKLFPVPGVGYVGAFHKRV